MILGKEEDNEVLNLQNLHFFKQCVSGLVCDMDVTWKRTLSEKKNEYKSETLTFIWSIYGD